MQSKVLSIWYQPALSLSSFIAVAGLNFLMVFMAVIMNDVCFDAFKIGSQYVKYNMLLAIQYGTVLLTGLCVVLSGFEALVKPRKIFDRVWTLEQALVDLYFLVASFSAVQIALTWFFNILSERKPEPVQFDVVLVNSAWISLSVMCYLRKCREQASPEIADSEPVVDNIKKPSVG